MDKKGEDRKGKGYPRKAKWVETVERYRKESRHHKPD